jgi:hypothetical protein
MKLEGVVVSVGCGEQLERTLERNWPHFHRLAIATTPDDALTQAAAVAYGDSVQVIATDACYLDDDTFNKGRMINAGLAALDLDGWLLLTDADITLPDSLADWLRHEQLDQDCLYYAWRRHVDLATGEHRSSSDPNGDHGPWGYFQLVHAPTAARLCGGRLAMPECFCSAGTVDHWFALRYSGDRHVSLPKEMPVLHFWHGDLAHRWNSQQYAADATRWRYVCQTTVGGWRHRINRAINNTPGVVLVKMTNIETGQSRIQRIERSTQFQYRPRKPGIFEFAIKKAP